jgi:predicted DNA binding protein
LTKGMIMLNGKLNYGTGAEISVYKGEFEVVHPGCVFVETAKCLSNELELEILNREPENSYYWARFFIENTLSEHEIQSTLKPSFDSGALMRARVWCNGATVFEVLVNDVVFKGLQPIVELPFGDIVSYTATLENENAVVLSPPSDRMSGKELLLEIEEKLKEESKEAELISYSRITEDETWIAYTFSEETPQWLNTEEERILEAALVRGYFEIPKRISVEQLADHLEMSSTTLNNRLRSINRRVLDHFLKEEKYPSKR